MLYYALKALFAHPERAASIAAGFALSFGAVLFAYAIASNLQISSSAALAYAVKGSSVWVTGPGGPHIDAETRTLVQERPLPSDVERKLVDSHPRGLRRIAVRRIADDGPAFTVYWDTALQGGIFVSTQLADHLAGRPLRMGGESLMVSGVRADLPGLSVALPYSHSGRTQSATWVVVSPEDANSWAHQTAADLGLDLRDNAAGEIATRGRGAVFMLGGSLSRFDPFSFQTKFSAFQLNSATSSLLGWLARAVFVFGAILVISSARIGIAERREEVAVLTVLGFQPELTLLILIENAVLLAIAIPVGFLLAAGMATQTLPAGNTSQSLAAALRLTLFFVPVVIALATLWAGQYVAGQKEIALVRGGM